MVNGVVYIGSEDHKLYAFNATSGALLPGWPVITGGLIESSPAVFNGLVYILSFDGKLYAFKATTGVLEPGWPVRAGISLIDDDFSSPVVANGVVYVGSLNGNLYAFNALTGAMLWSATALPIQSSPAVVNGTVYLTANDHRLHAYNLAASLSTFARALVAEREATATAPDPAVLVPDYSLQLRR